MSALTVNTNTLTINPPKNLGSLQWYSVLLPLGTVTDLSGNPMNLIRTLKYCFRTQDKSAPKADPNPSRSPNPSFSLSSSPSPKPNTAINHAITKLTQILTLTLR